MADGKFLEIKHNGVGHQFFRASTNTRVGEKRCIYCGKWFQWAHNEPAHCGNSACEYFHQRYIKHSAVKMGIDTPAFREKLNDPQFIKSVLHKSRDLAQAGMLMFNRKIPIQDEKRIIICGHS